MAQLLRQTWNQSRGSLSLMLVWVCIGVFVCAALLDSLGIVSRREVMTVFGLTHYGVCQRFWVHQFLTAPLLHAGVGHLLFNMLALWMLGPEVESVLGRRRYVEFTLLCAIVSMLGGFLSVWSNRAVVIGYSGVIFGILTAQAVFFPSRQILMFYFFPMKMRTAAIVMGAVELYLTVMPENGGSLAHAAHVGGAIAGYAYLRTGRAPLRWGLRGSTTS